MKGQSIALIGIDDRYMNETNYGRLTHNIITLLLLTIRPSILLMSIKGFPQCCVVCGFSTLFNLCKVQTDAATESDRDAIRVYTE